MCANGLAWLPPAHSALALQQSAWELAPAGPAPAVSNPAPCLLVLLLQLEEGTKSGTALLSDKCLPLVDVAEPPNMKQAFEAGLTVALLQSQLSAVESTTGLTMLKRDTQGNAQVRLRQATANTKQPIFSC